MLNGRKIIVVVSGGIAAYKSADLVSRLKKAGAEVRVAMTRSAQEFVGAVTFESLAGYPVYQDVFERPRAWEMEHIAWARWADAIVAAPATAHLLARLALGLADDAVTTLALAYTGPLYIAPAMNSAMWQHPATQENLKTLLARGVKMIEPGEGALACGEVGPGRMAEPADIVEELEKYFATGAELKGKTVLITAGPTREKLDPIRFISNRSTGRMGAELAAEAAARGARVIFVHGPMSAPVPAGVEAYPVESAREMLAKVKKFWAKTHIAVFAAAVANYESGAAEKGKIKGGDKLTLELKRTPDIAGWAGENRKKGQLLVGFCAESENLIEIAKQKLKAKKLDLICANPIGEEGVGFEAAENRVVLIDKSGKEEASEQADKREIAGWIWNRVKSRK
ncbi:bifunctional phosphopantothenoylcysteine decarboxylase/phosphopantothenate--cysteine ligase CoaBC [bacterium]|nr:bifunctional phosphopantothenoylcysteine decarboxylase/phosphopantothenate--cysteine ligase CoaBC [bacterium]